MPSPRSASHLALTKALEYAAQGLHVFPVHAATKAPRTRNGYLDATTNADPIGQWWTMWPDAGIGVALAASGLVDIAPDSPEYLAQFRQRGLPTDAVFTSPGGDGHEHYLFRRPAGCPTARVCRSGEYDLLSDGYAILPNGDGSRVWKTEAPNLSGGLPDAPAWAVEWLREHTQQRAMSAVRRASAPAFDAADEPPVHLRPVARATWQGLNPKVLPGGTVDRSASLVKIGRVLSDARMTRRGIVAELRSRDHDLGYHKYCCNRDDGEDRYEAIVDELERGGRTPGADLAPEIDGGGDQVASLRARIDQVEAQLAEAVARFQAVLKLDRNPAIKTQRTVVKAVAYELEAAYRRGASDADGWVKVLNASLAENAGVSVDRVSAHTNTMVRDGLIDKQVRYETVTSVDHATGEVVVKTLPRVYLRCRDVGAMLAQAATWVPSLDPTKPARAGWGGRRDRCADCGSDRLQRVCLDCGAVQDREPQDAAYQPPAGGRDFYIPQDAVHHPGGDREAQREGHAAGTEDGSISPPAPSPNSSISPSPIDVH